MGGGRRNFMDETTADPEYPDKSTGYRTDGRNLIEVKYRSVSIVFVIHQSLGVV